MLAQSARVGVVARLVAANSPAMAGALAPPALVALGSGAPTLAAALAPGLAFAVFLMVWSRVSPAPKPRRGEALVSVAASFVLTVFLAAPAFVALGASAVDALFEAASSVTTTGLSVAAGAADWPYAGHFLRAWLQWIGGFAFVAAAVALVIGQGVVAKRLGAASGVGEDRAASARLRARRLLAVYAGLSAVVVAAAAIAHEDPLLGALVALSSISTGGFAPYGDSLASVGASAQIVAALGCLAGAVSLGLWWLAIREGPMRLIADGELRLFAFVLCVGAAACALIEWRAGGAGPWAAVFTAISAQTTAGFSLGPVAEFAPASLIALIAVMAVGGCLGATSGGIKAFRLAFVLAATRLMLLRARMPGAAVSHLRVFGRKTDPGEGTDAMGFLALYAASAALLWFALVVSGAAPLAALFDAVSALSTVGLSIGAITPDMPDLAKLIATLAMLLGRLEFLALIVMLTPGTWKRG